MGNNHGYNPWAITMGATHKQKNKNMINNNAEPIWKNFAALNAVPRASKKEQQVIAFIKSFGTQLNLSVYEDEVGNVIIKKPASAGMESRPTVCLQSHLDMVHQKNNDTQFDFSTQGIISFIEGDWMKAKGTTLGADNGIGVATIMSVLESTIIKHPAIEALFTIDEETGMTGALALKGGLLNAKYMLNLDTEEDNELTIGCAGGIDVTGTGSYKVEKVQENSSSFLLTLKGLTGGHSGIDIHKGRANANKLMNRLLWDLNKNIGIQISSIDGGSLRNAIPRESKATFVIASEKVNELNNALTQFEATLKAEYLFTDPNLELVWDSTEAIDKVMHQGIQTQFLNMVYTLPNGIYRMDSNIAGLVQTSNNVARVVLGGGNFSVQCLTRSSVNTEKTDLAYMITAAFNTIDSEVKYGGNYPGWSPNPNNEIVKIMVAKYKALHNNEEPLVNACHAGLECGILGTNYPAMQMISFGPTIHGAHSPDEKVSISSVDKFWNYLLAVLEDLN
jgi:dipeptidase D